MNWPTYLFLWITSIYGSLETSFPTATVQEVMAVAESREVEWRVAISDNWDVSEIACDPRFALNAPSHPNDRYLDHSPYKPESSIFCLPRIPSPRAVRTPFRNARVLEFSVLVALLPVDRSLTYPSAYSDGGFVSWLTAQSVNGTLEVWFPSIRCVDGSVRRAGTHVHHVCALDGLLSGHLKAGQHFSIILSCIRESLYFHHPNPARRLLQSVNPFDYSSTFNKAPSSRYCPPKMKVQEKQRHRPQNGGRVTFTR